MDLKEYHDVQNLENLIGSRYLPSDIALPKAFKYVVTDNQKISEEEFLDLVKWSVKNDLKFVTTHKARKGTIMFLDKKEKNLYAIYESGYVRRLFLSVSYWGNGESITMYPINKRQEGRTETGFRNTYIMYENYKMMIDALKLYVEKRQKRS